MKTLSSFLIVTTVILAFAVILAPAQEHNSVTTESALRAAASYLDGRLDWWEHWPNAARDHDTQCISCHTALPYALARPKLRGSLGEHDAPAAEKKMLEFVTKRVRGWKE